ncbi:membrane protein, probable [Alloactinosynnema sp. L-07]|uniref:MFS transporter n=1 Tax=Alloactinosynnema sp. L-07 TaxID=1653480 RepID=UPI00065EF760|nr:MFS transporter [Alloactinosynnema sp. L-07]CRK58814.1 membrane protein, probable [Alloactinosynnema sp. L-07]
MAVADPPTVADPVTKVSARWISGFCLAVVGTFVGWYGPLQILLAKQADAFDPAGKESVLAVVALLGATVSLLANPVWGALSDRTTSRFGRRIPWVVVGTVGGVAGLLVLAAADGIGLMIIGWCLVQLTLNAPLAALSAAIPDQVPVAQRGTAGGYFGLAQMFGVMAGTGLAVAGGSIVGGYVACAAFVLLAPLPYVLLGKDTVITERPPWHWRAFLSGFWISPRRYPDFAWAWFTRFLMNVSNAIALLYLLFYLKDGVRIEDPETGVLILTVLDACTMLITVMVAGVWSDRIGRRRVFVFGSGVIMAVAAMLLAVWPTWAGAVTAAIVLGVGFGAYTSVDFALITQVLPRAADRGRDLGVLNVANTLPQVLAPVVAAPIVRHLGGYPMLFSVSALVALVGALLVYRIKSVR